MPLERALFSSAAGSVAGVRHGGAAAVEPGPVDPDRAVLVEEAQGLVVVDPRQASRVHAGGVEALDQAEQDVAVDRVTEHRRAAQVARAGTGRVGDPVRVLRQDQLVLRQRLEGARRRAVVALAREHVVPAGAVDRPVAHQGEHRRLQPAVVGHVVQLAGVREVQQLAAGDGLPVEDHGRQVARHVDHAVVQRVVVRLDAGVEVDHHVLTVGHTALARGGRRRRRVERGRADRPHRAVVDHADAAELLAARRRAVGDGGRGSEEAGEADEDERHQGGEAVLAAARSRGYCAELGHPVSPFLQVKPSLGSTSRHHSVDA